MRQGQRKQDTEVEHLSVCTLPCVPDNSFPLAALVHGSHTLCSIKMFSGGVMAYCLTGYKTPQVLEATGAWHIGGAVWQYNIPLGSTLAEK